MLSRGSRQAPQLRIVSLKGLRLARVLRRCTPATRRSKVFRLPTTIRRLAGARLTITAFRAAAAAMSVTEEFASRRATHRVHGPRSAPTRLRTRRENRQPICRQVGPPAGPVRRRVGSLLSPAPTHTSTMASCCVSREASGGQARGKMLGPFDSTMAVAPAFDCRDSADSSVWTSVVPSGQISYCTAESRRWS